jgi:hypothetical protein
MVEGSKKLRASASLFRMNSNPLPWNWLVPFLRTALIIPPPLLPNSAEYVLERT